MARGYLRSATEDDGREIVLRRWVCRVCEGRVRMDAVDYASLVPS